MSQHKNKLNREKQARVRLFYVATKVPTQCKEVLSRQNKPSCDRTSKLNAKESCRDMKNGPRHQILTSPRSYVATSEQRYNKKSSSMETSLYRDRLSWS